MEIKAKNDTEWYGIEIDGEYIPVISKDRIYDQANEGISDPDSMYDDVLDDLVDEIKCDYNIELEAPDLWEATLKIKDAYERLWEKNND